MYDEDFVLENICILTSCVTSLKSLCVKLFFTLLTWVDKPAPNSQLCSDRSGSAGYRDVQGSRQETGLVKLSSRIMGNLFHLKIPPVTPYSPETRKKLIYEPEHTHLYIYNAHAHTHTHTSSVWTHTPPI